MNRDDALARDLDAADPLARFRDEFHLPPGQIYLDGNSLGPMSRRSEASAAQVLDAWKTRGIGGWTEADPAWFSLAERLGATMAGLVGAEPDEVVVANSTTVNLHQGLATLFQPAAGRSKILADALAFPSDLYAIQSHLRGRGLDPATHLKLVPSHDGRTLSDQAIDQALTDDVAVAVLPTVLYRSGQLLDLDPITRAAHDRGVRVLWDGSHSVGVVPHRFSAVGVDFAFWCSYKYLNGGPGAPAALYLNRRHFGVAPGLAGWFGSRKDRQFAMSPEFEPEPGAGGLQVGTPPILALGPMVGALELVAEAGVGPIRRKSLALTSLLRTLVERDLGRFGVSVATPEAPDQRGGHLALVHPEARRITRALIAAGVVPDFRPPDIVRLAPVPLYTRFGDVVEAVRRLGQILDQKGFEAFPGERGLVP